MKPGYIIEYGSFCSNSKLLLVYNFNPLNNITCLPAIQNTGLIKEKNEYLIGIWKPKKIKL